MDDLRSVEVVQARGVATGLRLSSGPLRHRAAPLCQLATWVSETLHAAERVAGVGMGDGVEVLPLFWIRLYGVLTDVADFVSLSLGVTVEQAGDGLCMFPLAREQRALSPLPMAMEQLRALLDEDDLLYVEYRRHVECEPFQTKYRARRGRHGTGHVPSVLLDGRPVTIEQAEAAFERLFLRHAASEDRIGVELARRLIPALRALDTAAREH
jgi:hypothetical protein